MLRMYAVQTERDQVRYEPLQPYWDEKNISRRCRPWQQILMFFARTQREHEWSSPRYRFNRQQRRAWERLLEEAERQVQEGDEEGGEGERGEGGEEEEEEESEKPLTPI